MSNRIPADVLETARKVHLDILGEGIQYTTEAIARAIMDERERLDMALSITGKLQGLIIDVRGWINQGYTETATKRIDEMTADAWALSGWKAFCETGRAVTTIQKKTASPRS